MTPLPSRGSPPLQSGGRKSEVAHKWAKWLHHPCRLGDPHRFRARGKIRSGPLVGKVAMSPLPFRGSPPLQSGRQNQKWPTSGQSGYVTPVVSGIPSASKRGGGGGSEVAHLWAKWLCHPCRLGDPHRFRAGGKIRSGPQVGKVATSPMPSRGSPSLQSGEENRKWPTCGQSGYVTPAVSGIPTASEQGGKSEVAHKWAKWLRHPCRLGDPHRFRAGGKIRSGPQVGKVATSSLPSRGSPPLRSGGGNQRWPNCGQSGYVTPASRGSPPLQSGGEIRSRPQVGKVATSPLPSRGSPPLQSGGGGGSEVAHLWAKWLRHPCRLGDPHRFRAEGEIRSGPQVGKVATSPLPSRGSPPLQSGGGGGSEVAHLWGKWLRHPCRLGDPHRFRAEGEIRSGAQVGKVAMSPLPSRGSPPLQSGGEIRSGPLVGKVATSPLPSRGSPPLQSGGQNQKWPTSGKVATSPLPSRGSPPLQSGGGGG